MLNQNMQTVLDKIKEYNKIFIFRHFRPDGDAIGSTKGLATILRLTYHTVRAESEEVLDNIQRALEEQNFIVPEI